MIPSLRPCAECGRMFLPKVPRQKYCTENACALKAKNRRRHQLCKEDRMNLAAFRRTYTQVHSEVGGGHPDKEVQKAQVKYLQTVYAGRRALMHLPAKEANKILQKGNAK